MSWQSGLSVLLLLSAIAACDSTSPLPTVPSPPPAAAGTSAPSEPSPDPNLPPDPLVGRYVLELALGPDCGSVPDAAKHRTYAARIDSRGGTSYVVTLSEATFLSGSICTAAPSGFDCNQFPASRAGELLRFDLINENDEGHGGHIVERVPAGTWIEVIGSAAGPVQGGTITATGSASAWYCPTPAGYPFPCQSFVSCKSDDFRLTFTRR
jgi:hypothetical protein